MSRFIKNGGAWILILSVFWALAGASARSMLPSGGHQAVSFRNASSNTSFDVMGDLREEIDSGRVTAWTQRNKRSASSSELGSSATVDAIWLDGFAADIWDVVLVQGFFPQNDSQNCAIDETTANKIFGTTNVIGLPVTVDGVELTISGVFSLPGGLAAMGADPGYGVAFCPASAYSGSLQITAWEFRVYESGLGGGTEAAREWLMGAGIPVPSTVIDRNQQYSLFNQLSSLVGWISALALCVLLFGNAYYTARAGSVVAFRLRRKRLIPNRGAYRVLAFSLGTAAALLLLGIGIFWLCECNPYIPPEYLPTQWSDLSFWSDLIISNAQNAAILAQSPTLRPDAMTDTAKKLCWFFSIGSLIAMVHAFRHAYKAPFLKNAAYAWATALASPILAALAVRELGFPVAASFANIVMPFLLCSVPLLLKKLFLPLKVPMFAFRTRKKERMDVIYDENQNTVS